MVHRFDDILGYFSKETFTGVKGGERIPSLYVKYASNFDLKIIICILKLKRIFFSF